MPSPTSVTVCASSLYTDERGVNEVLREKPRLDLARADDVGDNQVIGAVIAECRDAGRRVVRVAQDQLVRVEQPGEHGWHLLAAVRGPWHLGDLRPVPRVADCDPTEVWTRSAMVSTSARCSSACLGPTGR